MNYGKLLGFGVLIYGVAFIVASVFVGFEVESPALMNTVTTIAMLLAVFLLAKNLKLSSRREMLKYSLSWMVIVLLLDLFLTARFTGADFFSQWHIWLAYALILLVPLLAVKKAPQVPQEETTPPAAE